MAPRKPVTTGDPFALLNRKPRWQAQLQNWRKRLLRPVRPDRIRPDRRGPANLLLIGVDTLRADHLGLHGYPRPTTVNLDRLAATGTAFLDVTAPAPWTLPSFGSALCGVMPGVHGAYLPGPERNMDTQPPGRLNTEAVTLAGHLQRQGYRTAAFYSNQFFAFGLAESFQEHHYLNLPAGDLLMVARDWIRRHADQPYFCFVLLNDPHEPTTPPAGDLAPFLPDPAPAPAEVGAYARWGEAPGLPLGKVEEATSPEARRALDIKLAVYDATIAYVDRSIAATQAQLEAWDLARSTLVSVFSDHGEEFLDHAAWSRRWNHDPRGIHGIGHGHTHFQELLHVPWLSWGPGVPMQKPSREPVSLCDLAPTLCDWLQVAPLAPEAGRHPFAPHLAGRSQATAGGGADPAGRLILSEAIAYGPDLVALRRGRWKLVAHRDGRPLALFDLLSGPEERYDVAAANAEVQAELLDLLGQWRDSGLGADGSGESGPGWDGMEDEVRRRLKDLGYGQ